MLKAVQRPGWFRSALAGAVALCVLLAGWMAASPELHEHLHHDAGHADHVCLATMIAHGGCESVVVAPMVVVGCSVWQGMVPKQHTSWVRAQFLDTGLQTHAPPVRI